MSVSGRRILLGVTGSVAAYKAAELARLLGRRGARVQVAMTRSATAFVGALTFEALTHHAVLTDVLAMSRDGDRLEIDHVERAYEVDLVLIAPASANTIARLAAGFADDALTALVLATRAPVAVAPAMETAMWEHPATRANLAVLRARGVIILGPLEGELASGRSGAGRMIEPEAIADAADAILGGGDLAGERVLITAGPTWEPIDPVRVITNRSTGAIGIALAEAAARRGAAVTLVLGPTLLPPPASRGVTTVRVETAREMLASSETAADEATIFIAAAAVSDYRPKEARPTKLKRRDPSAASLELEENPDVLRTVAERLHRAAGRHPVVVGFAAETERMLENAQRKLREKGADLVIANLVGPGSGFGARATEVIAVAAEGEPVRFGPAPKDEVAQFVLDQVIRLREQQRVG